MTIDATLTAGDLVTRAMQARRVLALGRTPTAAEMAYGLERLNLLLKTLAGERVLSWTAEDASASITGGDSDVLLDPRPSEVVSVGLEVSATFERPLHRWESGQYDTLVNKALAGEPTIYTVRETVDGVTLRVWPVPATDRTLHYRYVRVPDDVAQSSAIDMPQREIEAIEAMLAIRLTAFANGNPDLAAMAATHERQLYDRSRPDAYYFEPGCSCA